MFSKSPLRYVGGKSSLAKALVRMFPKDNDCYFEPFLGGGSVLLEAMEQDLAKSYVANDIDPLLINFWNRVKYSNLEWTEDLKETLGKVDKKYVDYVKENIHKRSEYPDLQAMWYFILNRCSFSGLTLAGGFSKHAALERFTMSSVGKISSLNEFLNNQDFGVAFNVKTFQESILWAKNLNETLIKCGYKDPKIFMYLDPPFAIDSDNLYGNKGSNHKRFKHEDLARELGSVDFKWLMSLHILDTYIESLIYNC